MKRALLELCLTAILMLAALQAEAFTVWSGGGASDLWSNTDNWSAGVGGTAETDVRFNSQDTEGLVNVDITPTVSVLNFYSVATNFTLSGNTISINNGSATGSANLIVNSSANRQIFNNSVQVVSDGQFDYIIGGTGGLTFNGAFFVSGSDNLQVSGNLTFNNTVSMSEALRVSAAQLEFANSVDNSIGSIIFVGVGANLTVNTASGVNFYDGLKFQHNANDVTLTFNYANVIGDTTDINVNGRSATYNFNADETLGNVTLLGGTMNVNLGDNVSSLIFGDSSSRDWTSGSLIVSNFTSGVVGFGVDGLTSNQVALISAYDASGTQLTGLTLDENGFLVTIPEPATVGMVGIGSLFAMLLRRRG